MLYAGCQEVILWEWSRQWYSYSNHCWV